MNNISIVRSRVLRWSVHLLLVFACLLGLTWSAVYPEVVLGQSAGGHSKGWTPPVAMVIPSLIAVSLMCLAPLRPSVGLMLSIVVGYGFPRRESYEFFCRWHVTEVLAFLSVAALVLAQPRLRTQSEGASRSERIKSIAKRDLPLLGKATNALKPCCLQTVRPVFEPLGISMLCLMAWIVISASVAYFGGLYNPVHNHNPFQMFTSTCLWIVAICCLRSGATWYSLGIILGVTLSARTLLAPQFIHLEGDMGVLQSISIPLTVMAIALGQTWLAKIAVFPLLGFQIWTLLRTENRGGLVALTVAMIFGWLVCKKKWRLLLFAGPILVAFGFAFANSNYRDRFEAIWRGGPDRSSVDSRFVVYEACWNMFLANPVFGVGLGNAEPRMPEYSDVGKSDSPHNNLMGMLAETGALGAVLYVVIFVGSTAMAFWRAFRTHFSALHWVGLCLGSSLIAYQVSGMFMTRHTLELAYLLAGGVIALDRWQTDSHNGLQEAHP